MSRTSDRSRFIPEKSGRAAAVTGVLLVHAAFCAFAAIPSLAAAEVQTQDATPDGSYELSVMVVPARDGKLRLLTMIATPSSGVLRSEATVQQLRPTKFKMADGNRTLQVEIPIASVGQGVSLAVLEGNTVLQRASATIRPLGTAPSRAEPISVKLKDGDLAELAAAMSQLTGREISLGPDIAGNVTIDVVDTPWDVALARAIEPLGLLVTAEGDALRIVRPLRLEVPPPPPGYLAVGGDVKAPTLLRRVAPIYTEDARARRIAGIVITQALIDENGIVKEVRILKDIPFGLGQSAAEAVRQWKFRPATRHGKPVAVVFNVTVSFRLDTTNAPQ